MFGLILVLFYAGYRYWNGDDPYAIYQLSTSFLYAWYIWTTAIIGVIYGIIALLFLLGGTAIGSEKGGAIGAILGFIGGGALSFLMLIVVGISRAALIIGSSLLMHALVDSAVPTWTRLS